MARKVAKRENFIGAFIGGFVITIVVALIVMYFCWPTFHNAVNGIFKK